LVSRTDRIELVQFTGLDGALVWLPVGGVTETFGVPPSYSTVPTFRETLGVVQLTAVVNRGLPDDRFKVDWKPTTGPNPTSVASTTPMSGAVEEIRATQKKLDAYRPPPPDGASVQQRLDRALAEADRQSDALVASSPARRRWNPTLISQIVVGGAGLILLVLALFARRRAA
jgi:hypothetical protein